jgi:hypothetical protein
MMIAPKAIPVIARGRHSKDVAELPKVSGTITVEVIAIPPHQRLHTAAPGYSPTVGFVTVNS